MCFQRRGTRFTSEELIGHWKKLVDKYPIISIEDALDEEDWERLAEADCGAGRQSAAGGRRICL